MFFFCVLYLPVSVQWIDPDNRIFYIPHSTATIILTDWVDFWVNRLTDFILCFFSLASGVRLYIMIQPAGKEIFTQPNASMTILAPIQYPIKLRATHVPLHTTQQSHHTTHSTRDDKKQFE